VMEPSQSWFDRQSVETQRAMMGPGRFDLYRNGEVGWKDLGKHTHDATWGGGIAVVPVRDLAASVTVAA